MQGAPEPAFRETRLSGSGRSGTQAAGIAAHNPPALASTSDGRIPAKICADWMPAFAGMTENGTSRSFPGGWNFRVGPRDSEGSRRHDGQQGKSFLSFLSLTV